MNTPLSMVSRCLHKRRDTKSTKDYNSAIISANTKESDQLITVTQGPIQATPQNKKYMYLNELHSYHKMKVCQERPETDFIAVPEGESK